MDMLTKKNEAWAKADEMADNIARIKDKKAKRLQQSLVLRQWLIALGGCRG